MIQDQETIYAIALTRLSHCSIADTLHLYKCLGSATAVFEHRKDIRDVLPDASPRLANALSNIGDALQRAEIEYTYDRQHGIAALSFNDPKYPRRLRECDDAPLVLYYRGSTDLNRSHIVSVVGTRHCTTYGMDVTARFVRDLRLLCPDVLVVSGLAYGIDVQAHRQSLANGLDTVGVLAHGLDSLYPRVHTATATQMISHGGLVSEFLTGTSAEKMNFVRRNRIIAGLSDASIIVESAAKGGGLITMGIAQSYNRDTFAFPGNAGQPTSEGCNNLIRDNKAALISNAADFVNAMGWGNGDATAPSTSTQRPSEPPIDLTADEQTIVGMLRKTNDLQVNILATKTSLPMSTVLSVLFSLEMKGVVRMLAGGIYHLRM